MTYTYKRTFKEDYKFGKEKEEDKQLIEKLKNHFNDDLKKTDKKFCKWDYEGNNIYELKSRTNKLLTFPTTIIPLDKVIEGKNQYFIFNFTDKIGYIKYDKNIFNSFELKPFKRNQRADFNDKEKLYYFIPVDKLEIVS